MSQPQTSIAAIRTRLAEAESCIRTIATSLYYLRLQIVNIEDQITETYKQNRNRLRRAGQSSAETERGDQRHKLHLRMLLQKAVNCDKEIEMLSLDLKTTKAKALELQEALSRAELVG